MRVLAGLGNPGDEYERTRHNAGFWLLDKIGIDLDWRLFKGGELAEFGSGTEKALLFKPMLYMNRSGEPLRDLLRFYKIDPKDVCIAADDVYLAPGIARIRESGSDGGHNGWKSIQEQITPDTYSRVRIGVGIYEQHPLRRAHQPPMERYVLQPLPDADMKEVALVIDEVTLLLLRWLQSGELEPQTLTS